MLRPAPRCFGYFVLLMAVGVIVGLFLTMYIERESGFWYSRQTGHTKVQVERSDDNRSTRTYERRTDKNHTSMPDRPFWDSGAKAPESPPEKHPVNNQMKLPEAPKESKTEENRNNPMTSELEFSARRKRVESVCSRMKVQGSVATVFQFKTTDVAYCMVPKAGCTFWKRVYLVLKREPNNFSLDGLMKLERLNVHGQAGRSGLDPPYRRDKFPVRLIVTRDPFSRLISSYLDKAYLPDFWDMEMNRLLHDMKLRGKNRNIPQTDKDDFLRAHLEEILKMFPTEVPRMSNLNSTLEDDRCGKFSTFHEFVSSGFQRAEPHWMPIHKICNPCQFNVTHVGLMKTYTQDARAIFKRMGYEHVLDDLDHNVQVDQEIAMIVEYNFNRIIVAWSREFYKQCVGPRELAYRLWNNFRWRGYIHPDVTYVPPSPSADHEAIRQHLLRQVWKARELGLKDSSVMKKFKEEFTISVFKTLPKQLFSDLLMKYQIDFELFGHEKEKEKFSALYS